MKPRYTMALWAVFLALCVAYWWTIRSEQDAFQQREEAKLVFPDRTADDLVSVHIERPGSPAVRAEYGELGWRIVAPHDIEASPQIWRRIAEAVTAIRNERTLDVDDRELYGLETPRLRVELAWNDGTTHALTYGVMEPTARFRYAEDGDGTVFLVSNDAFVELDRPLGELRNPYLVGTGRERIERIAYTRVRQPNEGEMPSEGVPVELEGGVIQTTVVFEPNEDGLWVQTAPVQGLADQDRVDEFISHVQFATARDFNDAPAPLPNYGMQPAPARIEVWFDQDAQGTPPGTPESQTIFIGGPADDSGLLLYAKRGDKDAVFTIDGTALGFFPDTPNAFLEHRLMTYGTPGLVGISYRHGDTVIELEERGDAGWFMAAPEDADLDSINFSNFVAFLSQVEAIGFPQVDPAATGLDDPAIEIQMHYAGEGAPSEPHPIRVGLADATGESYYAQTDRGLTVSLSAAQVEALRKEPFYFLDKTLIRVLPSVARRVSLSFEGQPYEFVNVEGLWTVRAPEGLRWESQADMRLLLDALARARAVSIESTETPDEETLERLGLAYPILTAEVFMATETESLEVGPLAVGAVAPPPAQSRYARSADRKGVYHIDQAIVDDVREAVRGIVRAE